MRIKNENITIKYYINLKKSNFYLIIMRASGIICTDVIDFKWPRTDESKSGKGWSFTALFALPKNLSFHKNGNSNRKWIIFISGGSDTK